MSAKMSRKPDDILKEPMSKKTRTIIAVCSVAAAAIIIAVVLLFMTGGLRSEEDKAKWLSEGTYLDGISVEGVDLSGMTLAQAAEAIKPVAQQKIDSLSVNYTVRSETYSLTGAELSATIDYQSTLEEALLYAQVGNLIERTSQANKAKNEGVNFPLNISLDQDKVRAAVDKKGELYNTEPQDATLKVDTKNVGGWDDRDELTTSGTVELADAVEGVQVDGEKLTSDIIAAAEQGALDSVIEAAVEVTQPSVTKEQLGGDMTLMASATTYFEDSKAGRRYNIWKMSTVVNGIVLQPGEEWSINDAAGPRTSEAGWDNAAGIRDGTYVDEPGGGICQVSSTLYNALLKAEVEIVDRSHHSWPLGYVKAGLDATISTGSPDFVFKNNYDVPIAVVVDCDAVDSRKIVVSVYGPPRDYAVRLESDIVSQTSPSEDMKIVYDDTMPEGQTKITKNRHDRIVVDVYKIKYNPDTEEEISREKLYTDTYRAFAGEKVVGTYVEPEPEPDQPEEPDDGEDAED